MNKHTFFGNGKNKDFYFTFSFFSREDIIVKINNEITTGYGLFLHESDGDFPYTGGRVHFARAPKTTDIITIERELTLDRLTDYQETEAFSPKTANRDMNYFFELLKDIKSKLLDIIEKYSQITNKEEIETIKIKIENAMLAIDDISTKIDNMGDITAIQTNIANLSNSINNLTSTISTHTSDIGDLQTDIASIIENQKKFIPDYDNLIQNNNSAPETYIATSDCWVCAKGAVLAYDLYKDDTCISLEFLYSANYTTSWVFLPSGFKLVRRTNSQYNNFVVVPVK